MKIRKRPVTVEAHQWFKNGDHPGDEITAFPAPHGGVHHTEGKVVRRYRVPDDPGDRHCDGCGSPMGIHGWIDTLEGGHIVCPGDWIITGVKGERYPCKPDIFELTYDRQPLSEVQQAVENRLRAIRFHGKLRAARPVEGSDRPGSLWYHQDDDAFEVGTFPVEWYPEFAALTDLPELVGKMLGGPEWVHPDKVLEQVFYNLKGRLPKGEAQRILCAVIDELRLIYKEGA